MWLRLLLNGQFVAIATFWGAGGGTPISSQLSTINTAMATNGSPYQLRTTKTLAGDGQILDLSEFIDYSIY